MGIPPESKSSMPMLLIAKLLMNYCRQFSVGGIRSKSCGQTAVMGTISVYDCAIGFIAELEIPMNLKTEDFQALTKWIVKRAPSQAGIDA